MMNTRNEKETNKTVAPEPTPQNNVVELEEDDLDDVAGGISWHGRGGNQPPEKWSGMDRWSPRDEFA